MQVDCSRPTTPLTISSGTDREQPADIGYPMRYNRSQTGNTTFRVSSRSMIVLLACQAELHAYGVSQCFAVSPNTSRGQDEAPTRIVYYDNLCTSAHDSSLPIITSPFSHDSSLPIIASSFSLKPGPILSRPKNMAALAEINILGPVESARSSLLDPPNDQQISEQKAKPVLSADQVNNSSELAQENPHPTTALESGNNDGTVESPSAAETPPVEIERLTQERRIPEDDDTDSFVDSDDDSPMRFRFRNPHRIMRQASTLNQDQLYQVYKDRLERANRGNDKASALVKGFVDYMRSMEKRMKTLEEGVPSNTEGVDRTAGKEDSGKEDSDKVQGNRKELLEARFYHYSNAFDASGDLKDADDDQESAFTSDKGPAYLLRVVYDSPHNASSQASEDNTAELDPNDIDLIMMTIESAPIASFFEKRLGFEMRSKHTFRVAKPFRSILMNREIIEGHLIELKRNFR